MKQTNKNLFLKLILPLAGLSSFLLLLLAAAPLPTIHEDKLILRITSPAINSVVTNPFYVRGEMYSKSSRTISKDTVAYAYTSYTFDYIQTNETIVSTNKKYMNNEFKQLKEKSSRFNIFVDIPNKVPANAQSPSVSFTFGDSEKTYPLDNPYRLTIVFTNE